jgi:hypothetical protein
LLAWKFIQANLPWGVILLVGKKANCIFLFHYERVSVMKQRSLKFYFKYNENCFFKGGSLAMAEGSEVILNFKN